MRYYCPGKSPDGILCEQITKSDIGRRYLAGTSRERNGSLLITMRKRKCQGRGGCGHEFILRTEYPMNDEIAPNTTISYNWSEFANGLRKRPSLPEGGTTYSDFTLLAGRDTADCWWQVLGYEKPPTIKPARTMVVA